MRAGADYARPLTPGNIVVIKKPGGAFVLRRNNAPTRPPIIEGTADQVAERMEALGVGMGDR